MSETVVVVALCQNHGADPVPPVLTRSMVGVAGFEPAAFRSQSGRATKLRHTPSPRGAVRRFGAVRERALG